jgi:hypothetical protein
LGWRLENLHAVSWPYKIRFRWFYSKSFSNFLYTRRQSWPSKPFFEHDVVAYIFLTLPSTVFSFFRLTGLCHNKFITLINNKSYLIECLEDIIDLTVNGKYKGFWPGVILSSSHDVQKPRSRLFSWKIVKCI